MSVRLTWFLQGRILYSPGSVDREDIIQRNRLSLSMIETEGEEPFVHTLIDHTGRYQGGSVKQTGKLSHYVNLGEEAVRDKLLSHPLLGWVISIQTPTVLKMSGAVVSQKRNYRWHSVDSLEEALDFLQKRDPTLPDLRALLPDQPE